MCLWFSDFRICFLVVFESEIGGVEELLYIEWWGVYVGQCVKIAKKVDEYRELLFS
jgi:hypothetical protein